LFSRQAVFEVIGEKVHSLENTIKALSVRYVRFKEPFPSEKKISVEKASGECYATCSHTLVRHEGIEDAFVISLKIADGLITHVKMKFN